MDKNLENALSQALELISQWKEIPEDLAEELTPGIMRRLLQLVRQLRAQGLAGPKARTPERLLAMQRIINQWSPPPKDPEPDYPGQKEAESLASRQVHAQTALDQRRQLAEARRGRA